MKAASRASAIERPLEGKAALVTGAGRGIGRAHALALARAGAAVPVNDLGGDFRGDGRSDATPANEVVAEIRSIGGQAIADTGNVADWESARGMVESAVAAFGGLDVVVNNAGICRFANIDSMTAKDWDLQIAVNLTGTVAVSHFAARHWRSLGPRPGRALINTSSPAGTNPVAGSPAYCASKAAVAALTVAAAAELAHLGVRVNVIAPMARTRMTLAVAAHTDALKPVEGGCDRVAPEHISPLVVYLASERCRFTAEVDPKTAASTSRRPSASPVRVPRTRPSRFWNSSARRPSYTGSRFTHGVDTQLASSFVNHWDTASSTARVWS